MKKNLRTKFGFLFAFFLLLSSCRNELVDYEKKTNEAKHAYVIRQFNYEQLKKENPKIAENLAHLKNITNSELTSTSSKSVYNSELGFSIDIDKIISIEDLRGIKSYTFKITKDSWVDDGSLENLVLRETENGNYFVYTTKYDKFILEQEKPLSPEEIKNHFSVYYLGTGSSSEIFGLMNPCPPSYATTVSWVYSSGTVCGGSEHHNYADAITQGCPWNGVAGMAATPGGYIAVYGVTMIEGYGSCGVGGWSSGTSPNTGGGGSSTATTTPCEKIKKPFNKIPTLTQKIVNFANNTTDSVEHGLTIMNNADANTPNPYTEYVGVATGVNMPTKPPVPYMLVAHTHNSPANSTYSVPSWFDLLWIAQAHHNNGVNSDTVFIVVTSDGTRYAITIEDWTSFEENVYALFPGVAVDQDKMKKSTKIANDYYYGWYDANGNIIKEAKILADSPDKEQDLKYFLEMNNKNIMGINLSEANADFTQFTKVSLSFNGQIKKTPCN